MLVITRAEDDHEAATTREGVGVSPEEFTHQTLTAVTLDRIADSPARDYTEHWCRNGTLGTGLTLDHKRSAVDALPRAAGLLKIALFA